MFSFFIRKAGLWFARRQSRGPQQEYTDWDDTLPESLEKTIEIIRQDTGGSSDIVVRRFVLGGAAEAEAAIVFVDGLVNSKIINDDIMKPLIYFSEESEARWKKKDDVIDYVGKNLVSIGEISVAEGLSQVYDGFLSGDVVLLIDGVSRAIVMNSKGWEKRAISEPSTEAVIRGPRESFIESIRTNTAMIRRKIRNPALTFESMVIGHRTRTNVSVVYISGLARPEVIRDVKKRLRGIDADAVLESGYIEQYIEDAPGSIFATVGFTEKPDVVAAKILEGRVAIVVDGTPFVLTVPYMFIESFQAAEDYYHRPFFATLTRIIRILGFAITVMGPALYVAVTTYHQELLPTSLLITMANAREGVPFPASVECLMMIITFEILREAGIRLPRPVGQAMSIVGALVVGESAVSAGLIGEPMVIVVAITAVSGFLVPTQNDAAAILRLFLLILGASFGGFGITLGVLLILVYMASLESFGHAFFAPIAPYDLEDSKDAVLRAPLWMMVGRPKHMSEDKKRQAYDVPPTGTGGGEA